MKYIFLFLLATTGCTLLSDENIAQDYFFQSALLPYTNNRVIYITTSKSIHSMMEIINPSFSVFSENSLYWTSDFTTNQVDPNITLNFSSPLPDSNKIFLLQPLAINGEIIFSTANTLEIYNQRKQLVLYNTLDSSLDLLNEDAGPALLPGTGTTFAAGKWGNGVNCGSGTTQANAVRIPGGTIPMSDFSLEFWYTKTSDFSPDNIAVLFDALNTTPGARERLTLSIRSPWTPTGGSGSYYCILFGVQTSHTEDIMVYAYHDFEDLAALNAAFPLNTPVHIAVTKRNSDGRLRIFINGTALSTTYIKLAPFFTDDTSVIANVEGNFSSDLYIGNIKPGYDNTPAKGIIDNIAIYRTDEKQFILTHP